jgi:hypothetical protein
VKGNPFFILQGAKRRQKDDSEKAAFEKENELAACDGLKA